MLPCTGCYAHEELTLSTFSVEVCLLQILVKLSGFMFLVFFFLQLHFYWKSMKACKLHTHSPALEVEWGQIEFNCFINCC